MVRYFAPWKCVSGLHWHQCEKRDGRRSRWTGSHGPQWALLLETQQSAAQRYRVDLVLCSRSPIHSGLFQSDCLFGLFCWKSRAAFTAQCNESFFKRRQMDWNLICCFFPRFIYYHFTDRKQKNVLRLKPVIEQAGDIFFLFRIRSKQKVLNTTEKQLCVVGRHGVDKSW